MEKKYSIGEFAKLTGITERTLRHYDQTGILKPAQYTEHGHRMYDNQSITLLQKILVLKFLDLSLGEISAYLKQPEQDLSQTLVDQTKMLVEKQKRIEVIIQTIARVQSTVSESDPVHPDSLLVLIHALKNDELRNLWINEHEFDSVYNRLHAQTAQIELDEEMTAWSSKMKRFIKEGKATNDPEVLAHTQTMVSFMKPVVEPILDELAMKQLEKNEGSFSDPDPYLFPNSFTKEEEEFVEKVIYELLHSKGIPHHKDTK
ncbi:MerR family transcriptional regulator [Alkalicoccobacillus porphyridii]|uniref:MerR family transcriptional regulator n=1 Tax=Alkalicoccobacillus porphyridii TaxID=2597270 RepID=A0A554A298_9BACI|nr:MerR family transcriptional regulator [Alkalicoccobacillus porphyridii]TSB47810.1 MerR family transcriptional regulator [Alkalicoccobacillus porphyridii]